MDDWQFDRDIADAIVTGRILRLPTLRASAEKSMGRMSDLLWSQIEPKWLAHDRLSTEELQQR